MDDVDMSMEAEDASVRNEVSPSDDLDEYKMVAVHNFQKKLRLPKIFNYYYILDTTDPAGKSLRAMCKTCETTICYSRRATSNLITHLKRKHPLNYADYAELQSPSYISGSQSSYIPQTPASADLRGEQIILQVHDQPQMIDLTKQQYEVSQAISLPQGGTYSTYGTASTNTSASQGMDLTGMGYPPAIYHTDSTPAGYHHSDPTAQQRSKRRRVYGSSHITSTATNHPMADVQERNSREELPTDDLDSKEWFLLCMADLMLPPSVVTNTYFRGFVASLNNEFILPSEEVLTHEWIPSRQGSIKTNIIKQLREVEKVCINISQFMEPPDRQVVNLYGCFIEQWELRKVLLTSKIFKYDPTKEVLSGIIEELTAEFKLEGKLIQIIMEKHGGRSEDFDLPGFTDNPGSLEGEGEGDEKPLMGESAVADQTGRDQWLASFEQSLQSCIREGLKDIQQITECVSKVVHMSKGSLLNGISHPGDWEDIQKGWLDQTKYLKAAVKRCCTDTSPGLSEAARQLMGELFDTLEPFEDAMDYITAHRDSISISFAVPCIRGLQRHLQTNSKSLCQKLLFQLRAALIKHLSEFEGHKMCKLAACLDPRFKMAWCSEQEADAIRSLLMEESVETARESQFYRVDSSPRDEDEGGNTSKLFKLMESPQLSRPNFRESKVQEEVTNYLSLPCSRNTADPLQYWRGHTTEFPTLSNLARKTLCVPAASLARGTSSHQGIVTSEQLSEEATESLMFIRNNSTLL